MLKRPWQVTAAILLTLGFLLPLRVLPAEAAQTNEQAVSMVEIGSEWP